GLPARCRQAALGDLGDRVAAHVDQGDIVAVESLVVAGIEAEPFGADRMVLGGQELGGARILDDAADLVAHELRRRVVGLLVHQKVVIGIEVADAAALLPLGLVGRGALVFGNVARRLGRLGMPADRERRVGGGTPARRILGLVCAL